MSNIQSDLELGEVTPMPLTPDEQPADLWPDANPQHANPPKANSNETPNNTNAPISRRINRVVGLLGRGGGGVVYKVQLLNGMINAACKVVPRREDRRPLNMQRAVREYDLLKWARDEKKTNLLAAMA